MCHGAARRVPWRQGGLAMFVFPGRVYALHELDAIEKIHEKITARGLKYIGPITLKKCDAQTTGSVTWYEFYVTVIEIA